MSNTSTGKSQYWSRFWQRKASRRRVLAGAGASTLALAAAASVGCGDDDDDDGNGGSAPGSTSTPSGSASPAPSSGEPKRGGITRFRTYQQGTLNYDIFASTGFRVHGPASFIYEPLVTMQYDADPGSFTVEPGLAESWEQPDNMTYTFKLRQGVKFQDKPPVNGRELVADDVIYSFERRMQPDSLFYGPMFSGVESVEATDASTITIKTKEPFVPFLAYLTTYFATIAAPEVESHFGDYTTPEAAIGTGRWLVDRVEPDIRTVYKPNPNYYLTGVGPYVDEHHEIVVLDDNAAVANFKAGELDYIGAGGSLPPALAEELRSSYSDAVIREVIGGTSAGPRVMMRADLPELPFKEVRVRQAMSLAIDREGILQGLFEGAGTVGSIIGPNFGAKLSLPIDQLGEGSKYFKQDIAEAKKLLEAAGYADGFSFSFETLTSPPSPTWFFEQFQLYATYWKEIGLEPNIELTDYASFIGTVHTGMPKNVGMTGPGALPDPDSVTYRWYHPTSDTRYGRVDDPVFTKMLEDQRAEFDAEKRLEILHEIQRYEAVQQQCIYACSLTSYEALQPWLKGLEKVGYYGSDPYWGFSIGTPISYAWVDKG